MNIDFINLKAQYHAYKQDIDSEIAKVLESSAYVMGESVRELEINLARFCGCKYARAVSSGTDALLLSLLALGIKSGDEVITTPFTFIATAEMIALLGARPVFVDINERTYNIDVDKIRTHITPKTKAIIPVSLYGLPADMDSINAIAKEHDLAVIEDACQSFGGLYKGRKSCNLGSQTIRSIGVTSFFPSKPLGCYGDGGAVFSNDEKLDSQIGSLLNHGQVARYSHKYIGLNARLDSLQCAVLNVKLKHFENELKIRQELANAYNSGLKKIDSQNYRLILPYIPESYVSAYAQYSVRLSPKAPDAQYPLSQKILQDKASKRDSLLKALQEKGIPTAIHYPIPLHLQESLAYLGYKVSDFPTSEAVASEIFSLPFSAFLNKDEQDYIISTLSSELQKL